MQGDKLEKVALPNGVVVQAVDNSNNLYSCKGCYFNDDYSTNEYCNEGHTKCSYIERLDNKAVIWIKVDDITEEQTPPQKLSITLDEIKRKLDDLKESIYYQLRNFEAETGIIIQDVDLFKAQTLNGGDRLVSVDFKVKVF